MKRNKASRRGDRNPFIERNKDTNISNSLVRGKAALEEAENHIKIFDEYLRKNSSQGLSCAPSGSPEKNLHFRENETLESDELLSKCDGGSDKPYICPHNCSVEALTKGDQYTMEIDLISQMMKQDIHRKRRDENMHSDYSNFSKTLLSSRMNKPRNFSFDTNRKKSKRKVQFDPRELSVAKRAVVKESIMAETHAMKEAEMKRQSEFQARPLPNGNLVKNDPYALTKAARGKISQTHHTGRDPKKNTRLDASSILNKSYVLNNKRLSPKKSPSIKGDDRKIRLDASFILDEDHVHELDRISPKSKNNVTRRNVLLNDSLYNEITDVVEKEVGKESDYNHDEQVILRYSKAEEEEKEIICLHQQISKLQAELNLKRMQCVQALEEIEMQGPIEKSSEQPESPEEQKMFDVGECFHQKGLESPVRKVNNEENITPSKSLRSNTSLYDRHNDWLKMREAKRKCAKEREDQELVKDVTGKPNLHGAQKSWIKAKQQHDGLLEILKSKNEHLKAEKQEKDRLIREKQNEEIERLKAMTARKNKASKSGIDGKKQSLYVDKLSRPQSSRMKGTDLKNNVLNREHTTRSTNEDNAEEKKEGDSVQKCNDETEGISFADMDDKEFSKMIKKLKAKARKGNRTNFDTAIAQSGNEFIEENKNQIDSNDSSCVNESNLAKIGSGNSDFTSSLAQAKLYAEINEMNTKVNPKKNENKRDKGSEKGDKGDTMITSGAFLPYQRYEYGEIAFFDRSSSIDKGRFRVRDAREYHADSLRRIAVPFDTPSSCEGVMFLVGKRKDEEDDKEEVVTILFDRSLFEEIEAVKWWKQNRDQIIFI